MSRFEFVLVLLSIIIGLGLTELLINIVRQIKERKTTKAFWPQSLLVAIIFLALLQIWWESWELQVVEVWTFPVLLLMLAGPITLFCISHLIFPSKIAGADMEKFYFSNSRLIWGLASFTVIVATLFRPLAFGVPLFDPSNIASLFLLVIFLGLTFTKNKLVHVLGLPVILAAMLLDILYFSLVL
jgi:hypothetical protein